MTPPPHARRSAMLIAGITLVFTLAWVAYALAYAADGPLTFVWIGTRFSEGDPNGTTGYDGQFAYYIARDGFAAAPYIDMPAYRTHRVLYPAIGRILSLGRAELLPWVMLLVNITAHVVGTALFTYLLVMFRAPAAYGLLYTLWVGNLYGVRLGLNEPLCYALALGAIVAYVHEQYRWAVILLMFSALTKEVGLVFAGGIALHALVNGKIRWSLLLASGPILMFATWGLIVTIVFEELPRNPHVGFHFIPYSGLDLTDETLEVASQLLWLTIPAAVLVALAVLHIVRKRHFTPGAALVLLGAFFVMGMPDSNAVATQRIGTPLILTAPLFLAQSHPGQLFLWFLLWGSSVFFFAALLYSMAGGGFFV